MDKTFLPASLLVLSLASTSLISHLFTLLSHCCQGLGTYIKLGVPLLFWPGAAKERTVKLRLSFDIFIPVPSPGSSPLESIHFPLSRLPVVCALERFMSTSEDGVVGSFWRTLWGRVFRPE